MQDNKETVENNIDINEVMKVRRDKLSTLQAEGMDPFSTKVYEVDSHSSQVIDNYEELEGREISCAGRIIAKRIMGKQVSAIYRTEKEKFSYMSEEMFSVMNPTHISKKWT